MYKKNIYFREAPINISWLVENVSGKIEKKKEEGKGKYSIKSIFQIKRKFIGL